MHSLIHLLTSNEGTLAVIVTAAVAVFIVCCLECSNCSCRDKDELFRRRQV
jgi:hypothetical protein